MKQFFNFLNEAKESQASMQAKRLGLKGDGPTVVGIMPRMNSLQKQKGENSSFIIKDKERDKEIFLNRERKQINRLQRLKQQQNHKSSNQKENKQKFFVVMRMDNR